MGKNLHLDTINWKETLKFIRNDNKEIKETNKENSNIRSYRIKNFLEMLPTNKLNMEHGYEEIKSLRCNMLEVVKKII